MHLFFQFLADEGNTCFLKGWDFSHARYLDQNCSCYIANFFLADIVVIFLDCTWLLLVFLVENIVQRMK